MSKISHKIIKEIALADAEVAFIYDSLTPQKQLLIELGKLRKQFGYTQFDIAEKLSTSKSSISRLESGGGREQHSPSMNTIKAYAEAIGCEFSVLVFRPKGKKQGAGDLT